MKTVEDLNKLTSEIIDLVREDPEIGKTHYNGIDDIDVEWAENYAYYEEDGWEIEIHFRCTGNAIHDSGDYYTAPSDYIENARGEVLGITALHYDEDTDETTYFNDSNLKDLWNAIDQSLTKL